MELYRHQKKLDFLLPTVKRLLDDYPNLYIDLSWTMLEPYLLDRSGNVDPAWVALVERHPTRFMIGSDVVGRFDGVGEAMRAFDPFLDALSEPTAQKVARDNFLDVLPRNRGRGE